MLSEAEARRLRAEVHAAMVAGRYDLARAKLLELAQRSRGSWPGPAPPSLVRDASPHRLCQIAAGLLPSLIGAGAVLAGVAALQGDQRTVAVGVWLMLLEFGVTLVFVGWLLLNGDLY